MTAADRLYFFAVGIPAPQGSHRAYIRGGRAVVTNDNERTRPWRDAVAYYALDARQQAAYETLAGPVRLSVLYLFPRPRYHYRAGKNAHLLRDRAPVWHDKKPDVDKLERALLDALTEAGCWRDDAQVAQISASKMYADQPPYGADITLEAL